MPLQNERSRAGRCAIAATLACLATAAGAATQTHSASFKGAGGDASYGNGDTSLVTLVQGFLPLFDTALGTLNSVDVTLTGWRSLDFSCTQGVVGTMGGCNAQINGRFVLDSINYPVWSFIDIASVNPRVTTPVGLVPERGETLSASIYDERSTSVSFSDPLTLQRHFSNSTGSAPWVDYRLYFQGGDGGAIGQGGAAAITALFWDADATVTMHYHYTPAVPEAGTLALMLAGLGAVALRSRRRFAHP